MKIVPNMIQGTPEWHAHRSAHHNASDAPAMLGISTAYRTRTQLLDERKSGITPELTDAQCAIFADGHHAEAMARPLAEKIIGDDLYPVVGTSDDDETLSASFDGLTLDEGTAFEHKLLSTRLRKIMTPDMDGHTLPDDYRAQMEQQCMVSGATRVLFMASEWNGDTLIEERHCWYTPEPAMRERILAGWTQFDHDLETHFVESVCAASVGAAPDQLPALRVEVEGRVLATNLDAFKANAMVVLARINRDLQTDDDFADAEKTVKWCKGVEERLDATKANVLAQMASVDEVCRTIDSVSAETRKVRLELDRLVKSEKENRKMALVRAGVAEVDQHYAGVNATLGRYAITVSGGMPAQIGQSIKGLKTLASIQNAISSEVARIKIEANQRADAVRVNVAVLDEFKDHSALFADAVVLAHTKAPDDLRNMCRSRIAEQAKADAERIEAERVRIRAEEAAKVQREAMRTSPPAVLEPFETSGPAHFVPAPAIDEAARLNLREINAMIAPLSISAAGLAQLGIRPAGKERASVIYSAHDIPAMKAAMVNLIRAAHMKSKVA